MVAEATPGPEQSGDSVMNILHHIKRFMMRKISITRDRRNRLRSHCAVSAEVVPAPITSMASSSEWESPEAVADFLA